MLPDAAALQLAKPMGGGRQQRNQAEQAFVLGIALTPTERIAVLHELRVQLRPVVWREPGLSHREDLGFFQAHVMQVELHILPGGLPESNFTRLSEQLSRQQQVLRLAHPRFAVPVIVFKLVDDRLVLRGASHDRGKQQVRLIEVTAPFGELIGVEKHRPECVEELTWIVAWAPLEQCNDRLQHCGQRRMLFPDDVKAGLVHGVSPRFKMSDGL